MADRQIAAPERVLSVLMLGMMVVGSFALWIGVPAAILWGLGAVADDKSEHLILALLAVPTGMIVCGIVLSRLNAGYLRLVRPTAANEGNLQGRTAEGPIESIAVICGVIAVAALFAWLIFGTAGTAPLW